MVTKDARSAPIPESDWREMRKMTEDAEVQSNSPSNQGLAYANPDAEFADFIEAARLCVTNLFRLTELTSEWRQARGFDELDHSLMTRFELIRLLRIVCDRNDAADDALASFVFFLLEADLEDDIDSLRSQLEEATFFGSHEVFDEDDATFPMESSLREEIVPAHFMKFYCAFPDRALIANDMSPHLFRIYLAIVAQFSLTASKSSVIVSDRGDSLSRVATFCSSHLQFVESLVEFPEKTVATLVEEFQFSPVGVDVKEDLMKAVGFMGSLDSEYLRSVETLFGSLATLEQMLISEDDDFDDDDNEDEPSAHDADLAALKERLVRIQSLFDEGLITQAEFESQRSRIISEL